MQMRLPTTGTIALRCQSSSTAVYIRTGEPQLLSAQVKPSCLSPVSRQFHRSPPPAGLASNPSKPDGKRQTCVPGFSSQSFLCLSIDSPLYILALKNAVRTFALLLFDALIDPFHNGLESGQNRDVRNARAPDAYSGSDNSVSDMHLRGNWRHCCTINSPLLYH